MRPTTAIHIGDFHAGPGPRNADRYRALDQILDESDQYPVDVYLWPGDLSHARQTIEDKNQLAARLQHMANRAPVILVYGNHDLVGDLDVFAQLHTKHPIAVVAHPECVRLQLANGEVATIFCLPYPTRAGLVSQGVTHDDIGIVAADALEAIFMRAAHELTEARTAGDVTLMVGHVNVGGSILASGQPNIGREIELAPRHLDRLGDIYKGLNHIHLHQSIAGAHYAGSVCRLDWGEIDDKAYNRVTISDDGVRVEAQPIHVAPMFHVEGELRREGFLLDQPDALPTTWDGAEVRVRYRYRQSEKAVLDEMAVRRPFLAASRLRIEPVAIPDRAVRAPQVAAARTLADKVGAWADVVGVTPAPTLVAKLGLLEHGEPAVLIAAIQRGLVALEELTEVTA